MALPDEVQHAHREREVAAGFRAPKEKLGRFGHHPEPDIDFEVEVDCLLGLAYDAECGMADKQDVLARMARALEFRVGGVMSCIIAKEALRERFNELKFS